MLEDILSQIKIEIAGWLREQGVSEPVVQIERSASPEFGEYSVNSAMRYAKDLGQNPMKLAEALATFLREQGIEGLDKPEAVQPGFLNLHLTPSVKTQHLQAVRSAKDNFGGNQTHKGEKWVIEHTSPNPNKAMHIGHLRLNLIGMGIVRLMKFAGAEVVADAVYNDRGIAIAKVMYGFLNHMRKTTDVPAELEHFIATPSDWYTPEERDQKPDEFISECYTKAELDFKDNDSVEQQVRKLVVDWEAKDESVWQLWRHVLQYSYLGNERVLNRLGSHWDKVWYEHEHYEKGKEYVDKGLDKGVFQKLEDGAVLTNLEENYSLPDTILLKKDGTSLYITQDIALTDLKKKTYTADKLVWVIGPDQALAMKQLFAVCEQLGIGKLEDFNHVSYGYVSLKGKDGSAQKMSSRSGTVVLIDDVIDEVKETVKARFEEEGKHDDSTKEELAEKLALAAVKFGLLKSDRKQDLLFDIEQSVDVHGDSGMYVMYTYVRTQSILRKATEHIPEKFTVPNGLGEEAVLLRTLLYYEEVVQTATADLSVHHVAQYLLELSSEFNSWYAKETILDGGDKEAYKLAIVEAVGITLKNGLELLGVETVDEM